MRTARAHVDRQLTMVGGSHDGPVARASGDGDADHGRVLIYGENRTGKELVARSIHAMSRRRRGPRRSQLRGHPRGIDRIGVVRHMRGAFTGAVADRQGSSGGRRRSDLPGRDRRYEPKTQAKVLRALQEQVVEP
jgi:DNA-binding NtrC family response regulator